MLKSGISKMIKKTGVGDFVKIVGFAPMNHFVISEYNGYTVNEIRSYVQQECVKKGVLFVGYHHTCFAHKKKHIEYTLEVYEEVFSQLAKAINMKNLKEKIEGKAISAFGVRQS
jgi:glutamate-1-semialdehyde aminotransferase